MLIAAALVELSVPYARSLKDKRRVARSVKDRLRGTFNVAVAEVDDHDDPRSLCLGLVTVGPDASHIRERLAKAIRFVDGLGLAELVGEDVTVVSLDEVPALHEGEPQPLPAEWGDE